LVAHDDDQNFASCGRFDRRPHQFVLLNFANGKGRNATHGPHFPPDQQRITLMTTVMLLLTFGHRQTNILILSLPHHGSSNDFHEEILDFGGLALAVATTVRDRHRVADLEGTLGRVKAAGKDHKVVDDQPENEFEFTCARSMKP
jgi:hypothetical protein